MRQTRSYEQKNADFKGKNPWIPWEQYEKILRTMIVPCVDIILHTEEERAIYLAKRIALPMASYWCLGGRMMFGDASFEEAAARSLKRESALEIKPSRFKFICNHLYAWEALAQGNFTGRNLAIIFSLKVSLKELNQIKKSLNKDEFDTEFGLQKFDRKRMLDADVHKAMVDIFDQLFP